MRSKRRGIAARTAAATAMSSNNNQALVAASAFTINAIIFWFAIVLAIGQACAGEFDSILRWRNIGPYRGGDTRCLRCAVAAERFYMAPVNGGVFKSIDYGQTWQPIFDDQPTASIGAIAVAPSNPDIVYVGSGEGFQEVKTQSEQVTR